MVADKEAPCFSCIILLDAIRFSIVDRFLILLTFLFAGKYGKFTFHFRRIRNVYVARSGNLLRIGQRLEGS